MRNTQRSVTESLARAALDLHRTASGVPEILEWLAQNPPREQTKKGTPDPTAGAAMDPRRAEILAALEDAEKHAAYLAGQVADIRAALHGQLDKIR